VADLLRLHALQWAGRGGNPEHFRPRFARHVTESVRGMVDAGQAAILEYRVGDRLVASNLVVIGGGLAGGYLYGAEPALRDDIDIATLLVTSTTELAHRRGCATMSMLRGGEGYKMRWRPPEGWLAEELSRLGVPSPAWPAGRSPGAASLDEARRLGRLVEARRPDVVHLHASKAGLAGRLALRGSVPTLFQPHAWSWLAVGGAVRRASIAWERAAARWTTLFVCVGAAEAEQGRAMRVRGRYTVVRN